MGVQIEACGTVWCAINAVVEIKNIATGWLKGKNTARFITFMVAAFDENDLKL